MPKLPWLHVLRVATLVALAASTALLSDYIADTPSFCSASSGCGAVRASELSHIQWGEGRFVPLPLFGVLGFAALFVASMASRWATQLAAAVGGLAGAFLLYTQALVLHQFCWLCVTTDVAALVATGAAFALGPNVWDDDARSRLRNGAWWALAGLAIVAPLAWPEVKAAPPVPSAVRRLYRADKINVVEFADFQCPACRLFSGILKNALEPYGERAHFVRLNKPLEMHQFARDAARAAVCAEAQGKAEAMAAALFAADDLSPAGIDKVAAAVGLQPEAFESCVVDAATDARVTRESDLLVPPELEGLPTTYIGGKRLLGVQSPETVADALERAARGEGSSGISGALYLAVVALLGSLILRFGLRRSHT